MAYLLSIAGSDRSILRFGRSPVFDLQLDGLSWADHIAARGWDVWLLDIRGFGRSTRPPEMNLPPEDAPPLATTAEAWRDFGAAVEFVLEHRGLTRLNALGWSWGTIISGGWTAANPGKVDRLVLFGPAWGLRSTGAKTTGYTRWTTAEALERLQAGAPADQRAQLNPAYWRRAWKEATVATDDQAHRHDPPQVRSPAGASSDIAVAPPRTGRSIGLKTSARRRSSSRVNGTH